MAYIYQIQNDINGKIYVGKTEFSIEKRFKEHCNDAYKDLKEKRPLYAAMRKYGIEHFHISLLEETDNPEERECYWIEQLRSFKNGYNATMGGEGKKYLDYDLIISTYERIKNITRTAEICQCDRGSVSKILKENKVEIISQQEANQHRANTVFMIDKDTEEIIRSFVSAGEALQYLRQKGITSSTSRGALSHITDVCKGKRKNAYGYKWSY